MSRFFKLYYFPIYLSLALIAGIYVGKSLPKNISTNYTSSLKDSLANEMYNLETMLDLVKENYVDSVDVTKIAQKGINDLLKQLDPHSAYIPAQMAEQANESLKGSFEGIGMEFTLFNDTVVVVKPIKGGPSERAGLLPGDKIMIVDGKDFAGINLNSEKVIGKLRGKRGSLVNLKVSRKGEMKLLSFALERAEIPIYSVEAAFMLDSTTAYFKIDEFAENTLLELQASAPYNNPKVKKVVMDLRGNPGGYLNTCIELADEFLKEKELIVYTDNRLHRREKEYATSKGKFEKVELVVLINGESASASEIFAGAIQDNDRGIVIGERSFGKGLVQEVFSLRDGAQMRLTVSRYYTPSGRCIQKPYKGMDYEEYASHNIVQDEIDTTQVYFTKNKRKVYGGGGVLPDVVIPKDSSAQWINLLELYNNDFIKRAALQYLLDHKVQLQTMNPEEYLNSKTIQEQISKIVNQQLIQGNYIKVNAPDNTSHLIVQEVRALIAKCIWDSNAMQKVQAQTDPYLLFVLKR